MLLNRDNWDRFAAGRYEEFLDRAEDYLLRRFQGGLLEPKTVDATSLRAALRHSQSLAKRLGRPTERMVVMLAKCFVVLGRDFVSDTRFASLRDQINAIAQGTPSDTDPVESYLKMFEPISSGVSARFSEAELESFAKNIDRDGGRTLLDALSDTAQTMGLFRREEMEPTIKAGLHFAEHLQLQDARLKTLLGIFAFRFGPGLFRDPFLPTLSNLLQTPGMSEREAVLSSYLPTILETPNGR